MSGWTRAAAALLVAIASVIAVVIASRTSRVIAAHDADVARLHALASADAALTIDVLAARAGILPHYDAIVRGVSAARDAEPFAAELRARGAELEDTARALDAFAAAARAREPSIETLKTDIALLRSSSRYFPIAMAALVARGGGAGAKVEALREAVERYQVAPNRGGAERIEAALGALDGARAEFDEAAQADLAVVMGHARAILERRERVDRVAREVALSKAGADAETARVSYERDARRVLALATAARTSAVALAIAALLIGAWSRGGRTRATPPR